MREAEVRFYVDADLLGLAKILGPLRNDLTYPGDLGAVIHKRRRPPCPIDSGAVLDTDWLPVVAEHGWLVITRDVHIRTNFAERRLVQEHGVRMVALAGREARTKWTQLQLVMSRWHRIDAHRRTRTSHLSCWPSTYDLPGPRRMTAGFGPHAFGRSMGTP